MWTSVWVPLLWLTLATPRVALAHPSTAEPPAFDEQACIVVVDKRKQDFWHLDYRVVVEDTEPEPDLIGLPDTKTHQFMAVQGELRPAGMEHALLPFGETEAQPMPLWLTHDDVQRTDAAVADSMVEWSAAEVVESDVLEKNPALSMHVFPFTSDPQRVPITMEQARMGADWDLREVPAGVYQITGYIFSPPYNGWAPRPGLVKIVDGAAGPPVVTLDSVGAQLFAGQGRRITGCVDAPEGSSLQVALRKRGEPEEAFESWIEEVPLEGPTFEICLPNPGINGSMEVRVELHTMDGNVATAYSTDVIAMFDKAAPCLRSGKLCCPPKRDPPDAGASTTDTGSADAGSQMDPADGDAGSSPESTRSEAQSPDRDHESAEAAAPRGNQGCGVAGGQASYGATLLPALVGLGWCTRRRARRASVNRCQRRS